MIKQYSLDKQQFSRANCQAAGHRADCQRRLPQRGASGGEFPLTTAWGTSAMKVLVTGGAGFIGSAVCRALIGEDWQVVNIDSLTYAANLSSLVSIADHPNYRFVQADICDRGALDAVFAEHRPQAVLHLAAESHVD